MDGPKPMDEAAGRRVLLLVDGHAYAYRSFHAIRHLSSPSGFPTNAIYGFIKALDRMLEWVKPTHRAVIWDGGLAQERQELLPGYKAQRPSMPSDLEKQMDPMVRYLQAAGVASFCADGVEADDWIGTLSLRAEKDGFSVVIASADKDFMQLVSPRVGLLNPNDKEPRIWGDEAVKNKTGVRPDQVVDWLALVGDAVDNIAGVPGVGPVTAAKLLNQYGTVAELYKNIETAGTEKLRENLRASREVVERNRRLIRLLEVDPQKNSWEQMGILPSNEAELASCYQEWGFKSLAAALDKKRQAQGELL